MPSEKMSLVGVSGSPFTCSGDMYGTVPSTNPACVTVPAVTATLAFPSFSTERARPKSSTFTYPSGRIMMFSGLMSRCTIPLLWAAASAFATCDPIATS
jgi:hypothetical protein